MFSQTSKAVNWVLNVLFEPKNSKFKGKQHFFTVGLFAKEHRKAHLKYAEKSPNIQNFPFHFGKIES